MNCTDCKHHITTAPGRLRSDCFVSCGMGIWGRKITDPETPMEGMAQHCKHYDAVLKNVEIVVYPCSGEHFKWQLVEPPIKFNPPAPGSFCDPNSGIAIDYNSAGQVKAIRFTRVEE